MEQQEMQEERRARNFVWGSGGTVWAGTAVSRLCTGGTADMYLNIIIGLSY